GWMGVIADNSLFDPRVNEASEFDTMVGAGVETVRASFYWNVAQPYPRWSDVPDAERARFVDVDGRPTDFSASDSLVALTTARGLGVLPVVLWAPEWARVHRKNVASPPNAKDYAAWVEQLVRRYGPKGTFWAQHPELPERPIRDWQLWNEPTVEGFWSDQPF